MSERIDRQSGDSKMVTFERVNKPEPKFLIEQVGDDPEVTFRYDWEERGDPTPEQFERLGYIEVKLVALIAELDDEFEAQADAVHQEIVNLKQAMMDKRGLDKEQRQSVALGDLDGLPEVERVIEDE